MRIWCTTAHSIMPPSCSATLLLFQKTTTAVELHCCTRGFDKHLRFFLLAPKRHAQASVCQRPVFRVYIFRWSLWTFFYFACLRCAGSAPAAGIAASGAHGPSPTPFHPPSLQSSSHPRFKLHWLMLFITNVCLIDLTELWIGYEPYDDLLQLLSFCLDVPTVLLRANSSRCVLICLPGYLATTDQAHCDGAPHEWFSIQ